MVPEIWTAVREPASAQTPLIADKGHFDGGHNQRAAILFVEVLYIAATQDKENAIAIYLQTQLATGTLSLAQLCCQFQLLNEQDVPAQQIHQHELLSYD